MFSDDLERLMGEVKVLMAERDAALSALGCLLEHAELNVVSDALCMCAGEARCQYHLDLDSARRLLGEEKS